jgi:hypothetical protein
VHEERFNYLRRFKCKKLLTWEKNGSPSGSPTLDYSTPRLGTGAAPTGSTGLLAALDNKRLEVSLHAAAKAQLSAQLKQEPTRGGNPSQGNKGDQARGQPKEKGAAPIKGKLE